MSYHLKRCSILVAVTVVVFVLGSAITCLAAKKGKYNWQKISPSEGRFEVLMPGKPTTYREATHSKIGEIGEEFYTYKDDEMTLTVEYSDLPSLATIFGGRHMIYKKAKEGFLKSTNGREKSFVNISVEGTRGMELIYVTPTRNGKTFFLLVSKRLYVIQASVLKKVADKSSLDTFLHSFKPIYKQVRGYKGRRR